MRKRILAILTTGIMALSAAAMTSCDKDNSTDSGTQSEISTTKAVTTKSTTSTSKKESKTSSTSKSSSNSKDTSTKKETYYCMGKNDTCNNKTSDPYDFYCHSCDPDNNNIEGDQR